MKTSEFLLRMLSNQKKLYKSIRVEHLTLLTYIFRPRLIVINETIFNLILYFVRPHITKMAINLVRDALKKMVIILIFPILKLKKKLDLIFHWRSYSFIYFFVDV